MIKQITLSLFCAMASCYGAGLVNGTLSPVGGSSSTTGGVTSFGGIVITGTNNVFIAEGDSRIAGTSEPSPWTTLTNLLSGKGTFYNFAANSSGMIVTNTPNLNVFNRYPTNIYPLRPSANGGSTAGKAYIIMLCGINEQESPNQPGYYTSGYELPLTPVQVAATNALYTARAAGDGFIVSWFKEPTARNSYGNGNTTTNDSGQYRRLVIQAAHQVDTNIACFVDCGFSDWTDTNNFVWSVGTGDWGVHWTATGCKTAAYNLVAAWASGQRATVNMNVDLTPLNHTLYIGNTNYGCNSPDFIKTPANQYLYITALSGPTTNYMPDVAFLPSGFTITISDRTGTASTVNPIYATTRNYQFGSYSDVFNTTGSANATRSQIAAITTPYGSATFVANGVYPGIYTMVAQSTNTTFNSIAGSLAGTTPALISSFTNSLWITNNGVNYRIPVY